MALQIRSDRKVVTAAATAEAIDADNGGVEQVVITAETDNTGVIAVGDSGVIATVLTRTGTPLLAGESITLPRVALEDVYIDATVSGDGVTYSFVA